MTPPAKFLFLGIVNENQPQEQNIIKYNIKKEEEKAEVFPGFTKIIQCIRRTGRS